MGRGLGLRQHSVREYIHPHKDEPEPAAGFDMLYIHPKQVHAIAGLRARVPGRSDAPRISTNKWKNFMPVNAQLLLGRMTIRHSTIRLPNSEARRWSKPMTIPPESLHTDFPARFRLSFAGPPFCWTRADHAPSSVLSLFTACAIAIVAPAARRRDRGVATADIELQLRNVLIERRAVPGGAGAIMAGRFSGPTSSSSSPAAARSAVAGAGPATTCWTPRRSAAHQQQCKRRAPGPGWATRCGR